MLLSFITIINMNKQRNFYFMKEKMAIVHRILLIIWHMFVLIKKDIMIALMN